MKVGLLDIGVRERFRQDLGDVEELAKDMRENGNITAITVRPTADDDRAEGFDTPYMLVAGGRRLHAMLRNGWEEAEVKLLADLPPLERLILELHENIFRKDMTWQEQVAIKAEIHRLRQSANPNHKQYDTARELKESPVNVSRDIMLAEALEAKPYLAQAGSKKAAVRMLEMEKHTEKMMRQNERGMQKVTRFQDALRTMDARDFLMQLEPGSVDLMYSDPLWGIDYWSSGHKQEREGDESFSSSEYDDSFENMQDVMVDCLPKMCKALKPTGWLALHCGYDAYTHWRELLNELCVTHYEYFGVHEKTSECTCMKLEPLPWIWHRPNSQNRSRYPDLHEDNRYEFILVANRGEAKLYRQHQGNVLVHDAEYGNRIHAMQKPISLCQDMVSRLSLPRMLVVDPFFGSGALLAGAASLERRIAGCDLNVAMHAPAVGYVSKVAAA